MVASLHAPTSLTDMIAAFPAMPHVDDRQPNLRGLCRTLTYMQACTQSHKSSYDFLNLLYIASEEGNCRIYARYRKNADGTFQMIDGKKVKQAMPLTPADPGLIFVYDADKNLVQNQADKAEWELNVMYFTEDETMNRALIKVFLSMLPLAYQTGFAEMLRSNPNMKFIEVFGHFFDQFGHTTTKERLTERQLMTKPWSL